VIAASRVRGGNFRRKPDSGYPKTAPEGMKKGAKGAKIGGPLAIEAVALGAFSEPKIEANDFSFSPLRKVVFFEASFAQRYFGVPYAAWNTNTCIPPLLQLRCS